MRKNGSHFTLLLFALFMCLKMHLQATEAVQKVALCFLTRDDLNFSDIWEEELLTSTDQFNIYIHSKNPINHSFFQMYRIPNIVPTTWIQHVKGWQALLREAVKNPENVKFVLLSESCMPLYPLSTIYRALTKDSFSYMDYKRPWWPSNSPREIRSINQKYRYGCMEYAVLNRRHAQAIADDQSIIELVSRYPIDVESYFATFFALHNCLNEFVSRSYTYINWTHRNKGLSSPYTFEQHDLFSQKLIEEAYANGHLFLRKVTKTFPQEIWRSYMHAADEYIHNSPSKTICPSY